jgi:hypothetical protein
LITIRLPSYQKPRDDFWSGDPAFTKPNMDDDEAVAAHIAKIKRARDTGDWNEILIPGKIPTKFVMQPIKGEQWRWIYDRNRCSDAEKEMGDAVSLAFCFRCSVVEIANTGIDGFKLEFVDHPHLGRIASADIVNMLDASDRSIVTELGLVASMKARDISPL